ncbi:MAG: ribosome recycling factor [Candidatus Kapabacteria bacterium]|jgi:ribosome recycling factor|nr:ribosome recycling factor [Candidatus Kapabacteria bacterium]
MEYKEIIQNTKDAMSKAVDFTKGQIDKVRTGRATVSLVDNIKADFYGSMTPITQMANISTPDARTIVIQPYDKSTMSGIEKAIQAADLGFNPMVDGAIIRIPVPPLTEERRKEYVKMAKKFAEDGKVSVRNVRREQIEILKKTEKDKVITEDERKRGEEEIQKITDTNIKAIDVVLAAKEKELMD